MPLIRKNGASAPKELGLFWSMQTPKGTIVDVFIYASALQSFDQDSMGPVGLLKRHRSMLESIASEKFDRDDAAGQNLIHVTEDDLRAWRASEAVAEDVE